MVDESKKKSGNRVVVVGLDGATFSLLDKMVEQGRMPNLERFMKSASRSDLRTVIPPITPAAWSTFMTGKNPGKHGIIEFLIKDGDGESPVNSRLRKGKTVWRIVNDAGGKVVSISVPTTYPPEEVDGFMAASFLTPRGKKDFAYPPEILEEIESKLGPYRLYVSEVYTPGRAGKVIDDAFRDVEYKFGAAKYLVDRIDWKLFVLHIYGTDRLQHELWHLMDPQNPLYRKDESEKHLENFYDFYAKLDARMGSFLEKLDPEDTVIMMSDHGFGPVRRFLNFNTWLLDRGYLKLKRRPTTLIKRFLFRLGYTPKNAYRLSMRLGLARLRVTLGVANRKSFFSKVNLLLLSLRDVDWSRTVAFSKGYYGQIFVNLKGRNPDGIVDPADFESIRSKIVEDLENVKDPENGKSIIGPIYRPEELYTGPYIEDAPDITFLPQDMSYKAIGTTDFTSNKFFEKVYANSGDHRLDGIFLARGPGVKKGHLTTGAWIGDITPTMLYRMGIPIPDDMDGKVLDDIFEPDFLNKHEKKFAHVVDDDTGSKSSGYTEEEKAAVRDKLKDMGYL